MDDKSERSINSSEILNSSLEKDNQNLNLNTKENNINSENKNLLNIKQTSSKIINKRKQTESNTNANTKMITESSILKQDKIGSLLMSQIGNKNYNNNNNLKISNNDKEFISQILYQHFLFKYMNNKIILNLTNHFELERFEKDFILYEEDSVGEKFYIVKEGTLEETFKNIS